MFYTFMRYLAACIVWLINGKIQIQNKDIIQKKNYIFVGPHRTWWEPIIVALAAWPIRFSFMAKKELFHNFILRFILNHVNAFPVDRKNPKPSAIKIPVKYLKSGKLSLLIYPSGTRHSAAMKGGVALIDRLTHSEIIPVVYQGPIKFSGVLKRKKMTIRFGEPLSVDYSIKNLNKFTSDLDQKMALSFAKLDYEINPNFKYIPNSKKLAQEKAKNQL